MFTFFNECDKNKYKISLKIHFHFYQNYLRTTNFPYSKLNIKLINKIACSVSRFRYFVPSFLNFTDNKKIYIKK